VPVAVPNDVSCRDGTVAPSDSPRQAHDRVLDTPSTGLKRATVSGALAAGTAQAAQFVLQIGSIAVLSRMLGPDAFGVVAMVSTLGGLMQALTEAGLSTPTVQRAEVTHRQVSNLFWLNTAIGGALVLLLVALAPAIAWFYREPRLVAVAAAMAPIFLLQGLAVQHLALLRRGMRYRQLALIPVFATLGGIVVGIGMAGSGAGYWSLVGMQLSIAALSCVLAWFFSGWRPQRPVRGVGTRPLIGFGTKLAFGSSIWTLAKSADGVLVGRVWGVDALGLYSRGVALMMRPLDQIMAPLDGIIVPALSRMQNETERYRRAAFEVYDVIAIMSMIVSGTLLTVSYPLTRVILGPSWGDAAPIFAAFTFVALYVPTSNVASFMLTSQGRGSDVMRFSAMTSTLTALLLIAGVRYGAVGVAVGHIVAGLLVQLPLAYYIVGRTGSIRTSELWRRFAGHLPLWVLVVGVGSAVRLPLLDSADPVQVAVGGAAALSAAAALLLARPRYRRLLHSMRQSLGVVRPSNPHTASSATPAE
jgi:O-antigen/teichoic acid export membrane protein